ncbi:MAG: hypothetical protein E6Q97_18925 [Desulfurellales bacterium]|nr:MAG: hypothetical protein E6Q97_18925 [Desulfurellales bacterium]
MSWPLPQRGVTMPSDLPGRPTGMLKPHLLADIDHGEKLHHIAARSWLAMREMARRDGVNVSVGADAYRPYADQERIFLNRYFTVAKFRAGAVWWNGRWWIKRAGEDVAAVPGTSWHGSGLAVDIAEHYRSTQSRVVQWLKNNGPTYGWYAHVVGEVWHWEYCLGDNLPQVVIDFEKGVQLVAGSAMAPQGLYKMQGSVSGAVYVCWGAFKTWIPPQEPGTPDGATLAGAQWMLSVAGADATLHEVPDPNTFRLLGPVLGPKPEGVDAWGVG